jgi:tetratricopeptide (TPR) repeat protein
MKTRRLLPGLALVGLTAWLAYALTPTARHHRHLSAAGSFLTLQNHSAAEIEYLNALRLRPDDALALAGLGSVFWDQGRVVRAHVAFARAITAQPDLPRAHLGLARTWLALGRFDDAVREARQAAPAEAAAPLILAEAAAAGVETERIERELAATPSSPSGHATVLVAQGMLLARQGKAEGALDRYANALAIDPTCAEAHLARAALLNAQGHAAEAEGALAAAASLSPLRSAIRLQKIRFMLAHDRKEEAATELAQVTQTAPDFVAAWVLRAEAAAAEQQIDAALAFVGEALRRDAQVPEALLLQARLQEAKGDLPAAAGTLQAAARTFPSTPEFPYRLGLIEAARGDPTRAEAYLAAALALAPGHPAATLALASLQLRRNDAPAATKLLGPFLAQNPTSTPGRLLLIEAHRRSGRVEAAIELSRRLEAETPGDAGLPLLTGQIFAQAGRDHEARAEFARALALTPNFLPALEHLSALDLAAGRGDEAERRVVNALAQTHPAAGLFLLQARLRLARQDLVGAESALLRTIELEPRHAAAYTLLAKIYQQTGRLPEALALAGVAATHSPHDAEGLLVAAVLKDASGDADGAREAYEQVLALDPRSLTALNNLACLQEAHFRNLDLALELAQRARQVAANDPAAADTLGWILYQKGYYSRAAGPAAEAVTGLPDSALVHYHLGLTRYMLGDEVGARAALERALGLTLEDDSAAEARRRLAVLSLDASYASAGDIAQLEAAPNLSHDPIALRRLGAMQAAAGHPAAAITRYEQALRLAPPNPQAALKLIELHRANGDLPRALEVARTMHRALPDDPLLTRTLATLALSTGDHAWAFGFLEEVAGKLPASADLHFEHAIAATNTGRLAAARQSLQAALRLSPTETESIRIRHHLAALDWASDANAAVQAQPQLIALLNAEPALVTALLASGLVAEARHDPAAAREAYTRALRNAPDFTPARKRLAILYAEDDEDHADALALSLKARREMPHDSEVARALGILLVRAGQPKRALQLLREAADQTPPDARLLLHLGLAQRADGRAAEARRSLETALQLQPAEPLEAEIRRVLALTD